MSSETSAPSLGHALDPGWRRTIALFLASQTISLLGSSLVQYAIVWHITLRSQSGVMMTVAILCGFLPTFFVSPFAGVWADRFDRRRLIALADGGIALATLCIAIYYLLGYEGLWPLMLASLVRGLGTGIQTPAVNALIPQLVPKEALTRVNAVNSSIQSLSMLVSPMASGALMSFAPLSLIFFIDVTTAIIGIGMLLAFVRVSPHAGMGGGAQQGYFEELREGFVYIRGHAYVRAFFLFSALFFFMCAPVAFLSPLQVARSFGEEIWRLTAIELAFFVGMTAGGAVVGARGISGNRVRVMALASFALGAATLGLGLTDLFAVYLFIMGVAGLAMPSFNIPSTVLLQEKVDPKYIGRVFGVLGMISSVMMPAGMLVFGPLADLVRIEWLLVGTGLVIVIQSCFLLANKALMKAGVLEG